MAATRALFSTIHWLNPTDRERAARAAAWLKTVLAANRLAYWKMAKKQRQARMITKTDSIMAWPRRPGRQKNTRLPGKPGHAAVSCTRLKGLFTPASVLLEAAVGIQILDLVLVNVLSERFGFGACVGV